MAAKRSVAVLGATGNQGGAVVKALAEDTSFDVWAITRDPDSIKAKALAEKGVRVIKADLNDVHSLRAAFRGAYGVFGTTPNASQSIQDMDYTYGKNIADACKSEGIRHLVFSCYASTKPLVGQACATLEGQAQAKQYMEQLGLPFTAVRYEAFMENIWLHPEYLDTESDGSYTILYPMEGHPLRMICVQEAGECIHQLFLNSDKCIGCTLSLASDCVTVEEMAAILTKEIGKNFKATKITAEQFSKRDVPLAEPEAILFRYLQLDKSRDDSARLLNPDISTFAEFVHKYKSDILAALA